MKSVEVKRQHRPPLRRCVELVLSGVKYRLFRAAITVGIISLAVAFLTTMLCESLITRQVAEALDRKVAPRRLLQFWVGRLSGTPDQEELGRLLARAEPGDARWRELKGWARMDDDQLGHLVDVGRRQQMYLSFFDELDELDRREAFSGERGQGTQLLLTLLVDTEADAAGEARLRNERLETMRSVLTSVGRDLPTSIDEFKQFLRDWWATRPARAQLLERYARAVQTLQEPGRLLHEREPTEALATTPADELRQALAAEDVGFHFEPGALETVRREARLAYDAQQIKRTLNSPLVKTRLAERRNMELPEVDTDTLLREVSGRGGAEWLTELTNSVRGIEASGLGTERIRQAALTETQDAPTAKTFDRWVRRLSEPAKTEQIAKEIAQEDFSDQRRAELQAWGDLTDEQMDMLVRLPKREKAYAAFFEEAGEEHKKSYDKLLADKMDAAEFLDSLPDETQADLPLHGWMGAHGPFVSHWLGDTLPDTAGLRLFRRYLEARERAPELRARIAAGHAEAVEALKAPGGLLAEQSAEKLLTGAGRDITERLAEAGFRMTDKEYRLVQDHLSLQTDAERLRRMAESSYLREQLARRKGRDDSGQVTADMLMAELRTKEGAKWLSGDILETVASLEPLGLSPERVEEVADRQLEQAETAETEAEVAAMATKGGYLGFSTRTLWLLVVSFVVCVVGIANAMLMSVTERFREIATMKCLGATDGFIMLNFVLESMLQGVAGSAIGLVLGVLLGLLRTWFQYGVVALTTLPALDLLLAGAASLVVGVVISAMAAVYPAWVAARLAPMEAMRIE